MDRFSYFLPEYQKDFRSLSLDICNQTLDSYHTTQGNDKLLACYFHVDCIISHVSETRKANMASAGVVLGLMPALLATLAPSIAETSQLSLKRPLLSLIISLGVPAVYPSRILEFNDPHQALKGLPVPGPLWKAIGGWEWSLGAISYLVVLASIANIWQTALMLSRGTVLSWGCLTWYMPLVWVGLPILVHLVAAVPFAWTRNDLERGDPAVKRDEEKDSRSLLNQNPAISDPNTEQPAHIKSQEAKSVGAEVGSDNQYMDRLVVFMNCVAGLAAFAHSALGICIFSSLLLVSVNDALKAIARFIGSAFVCRIIMVLELARIRDDKKNDKSS